MGRGLAGGVHSSICKAIRADLQEMTPEAAANTKVICVGDKSRAFMARYFPKNLFSQETVMGAEKITAYDSVDADVVQSYLEFSLASLVYYAMKEGACSEQSSRLTAMDNSSKNAGEMIDKLTITFNRTRQAVITGELIEIISGAAAL